jgi:site-specific recombinase XerD
MDKFEQEVNRIRKDNKAHLFEFEKWLTDKGLAKKTIKTHVDNVDFYINEYLLYDDADEAAVGIGAVCGFFDYWFPRKALWCSRSSIKSMAASLKKFYGFFLEQGFVAAEDYEILKDDIKEGMEEWLDEVDEGEDW